MKVSFAWLPLRHSLLGLAVASIAVSTGLPIAAASTKNKPPKKCLALKAELQNKQPTAPENGFAFGYVELTLVKQVDAKKGDKGFRSEKIQPFMLFLRRPDSREVVDKVAVACEKGLGSIFFVSDLPPGEIAITQIYWMVTPTNQPHVELTQPVRFTVRPSSATFVGSFRLTVGPFTDWQAERGADVSVTRSDLQAPTAAELASDLAQSFGQPWHSYLESVSAR